MKLYALSDGPPSLAVRMVMKALDLEYEYIAVDYNGGEHLPDDYAKVMKLMPLRWIFFYKLRFLEVNILMFQINP